MSVTNIVQTCKGKVRGIKKDHVTIFRSIPYARAPIGEYRWKPPHEAESWEGVRECTTFGNIPWQPEGFVGTEALVRYPQSEDCLYLNIWTPAENENENLPVLFWIHGGAFLGGAAHENLYNGENLALKGVIVVSISYRLGIFGFLAHPDFNTERSDGTIGLESGSGNFGLLDIIFGLKWVKQNIYNFGGDPNRVTIAGQSAGGMAVQCLLSSPMAKGQFSGAIIQSAGPSVWRKKTQQEAENIGLKIAEILGCKGEAELRKVEPCELRDLSGKYSAMTFAPVTDGKVLPIQPAEAFLRDEISQVPIMMGSNSHECLSTPLFTSNRSEFLSSIQEFWKEKYSLLEAVYNTESKQIALEMGGDFDFVNIQYFLRRIIKKHTCPVYQYYFSQPIILEDGTDLGAVHSSELFYVFDTLNCMGGSTIDGTKMLVKHEKEDAVLADNMTTYWTNFVKNGNPNSPELEQWHAFTKENPKFLHFHAKAVQEKLNLHLEKTAVIEKWYENELHLF